MFKLDSQLANDTIVLGDLPLCRVLLCNDAQYPWLILVPRRNNIRESYQLNSADRELLKNESDVISRLIMTHFKGEKLNVAALGNMVPQLHIHHIVRFSTDAAWPKPVWGQLPATPYTAEQQVLNTTQLITLINSELTLIS